MADRVSVSPITEDMVHRAAVALSKGGWSVFEDAARIVLSAALAGYTVVAAPDLIEMPTFTGCTDRDPWSCACGEGPICCAACGDPIEDGAQAWSFRYIGCPWEADGSAEQEWGDVFWHEHCDRRSIPAGGSQVGDQ